MALTIEQLIAQQRSRIAALLAERQPHTDTITRLREVTAADPDSGREERNLTEAEATEARTAREARTRIDAQISAQQARLDEYEAEQRDQQAVDALQRQVGSVLQTGAAPLRDDANFSYVAAWEFKGVGQKPELHKEPLEFEEVHPSQRSYK